MSRPIKTQHPRSMAALVCEAVIHDGRSLGEAIEQVLVNFRDDQLIYEEAIVLSSNLNRIELESRIGTLSSDDSMRNRNRIAYGLIELINRIG